MARLSFFTSTNMLDTPVWYTDVIVANSSMIELSDGFNRFIYFGNFSYDFFGNIYGTLRSFYTYAGNRITSAVTEIEIDISRFSNIRDEYILSGSDIISGSNGHDTLLGYSGNDWIDGFLGDDWVLGGAGNDTLTGGGGNDIVDGGDGDDSITGSWGDESLFGGLGADTFRTGGGTDGVSGGLGTDRVIYDFAGTSSRWEKSGSIWTIYKTSGMDVVFDVEFAEFTNGILNFTTGSFERYNQIPVVTASSPTVARGTTLSPQTLLTVTDRDGDPITTYEFWDSTPGGGRFTLAGVEQPVNQAISVTAAQLGSISFTAANGGADQLWVRAFDGLAWSNWAGFTVATPNSTPVISASNQSVSKFAQPALSSLFSVTDSDGDGIQRYQFWDSTAAANSGSFVVANIVQSANTSIDVSAAQLGSAVFRSGSGADQLWMRAHDGIAWSDWASFTVTAPINAAPVATAAGQTVARGTTLSANTLFNVSDSNGDAITTYEFWDSTPGGGRFTLAGVEQPVNQAISVTAAQLGSISFTAANGGADQLWVRAFDGLAWSNWAGFTVAGQNQKPLVTAFDHNVAKFAQPAAATLFNVVDPEGMAITAYEFWDSTTRADSGGFVVGGVAQAAGQAIPVTAAQLAATTFRSGSGADQLWIRARDGIDWSDWMPFTVTAPINTAPVVTAPGQTVARGTTLSANTLFNVSDSNGDAITAYQFWDSTAAATSGSFVVGGVAQAAHEVIDVTAAQFASTIFRAGSGTDSLWARANDGISWSSWMPFSIDAVL